MPFRQRAVHRYSWLRERGAGTNWLVGAELACEERTPLGTELIAHGRDDRRKVEGAARAPGAPGAVHTAVRALSILPAPNQPPLYLPRAPLVTVRARSKRVDIPACSPDGWSQVRSGTAGTIGGCYNLAQATEHALPVSDAMRNAPNRCFVSPDVSGGGGGACYAERRLMWGRCVMPHQPTRPLSAMPHTAT